MVRSYGQGLGAWEAWQGLSGYHSSLPMALMDPVRWHTAERSQGSSHGMLSDATAAARLSPFLTITVPCNCDPHTSTERRT